MRSPFPGVDPYLENQGRWPDFHARFLTYCCDILNDRLPDQYVAQMDERIRLVEPPDDEARLVRPDLLIGRSEVSQMPMTSPSSTGTVTLEPVTIPVTILEEVRETRVEILHVPDRMLVTVLELLSPSNKTATGLEDYRAKRVQILGQPVHLVEWVLLVGGHRLPMRRSLPPGDYYSFVARAECRPNCEVYSWSVRQPLPTIPVPLMAPDPDILLDLADLFATAYARGRYSRLIDYKAPLTLPLAPEDRDWAEKRARGEPNA